jgi:hypothetical protein
MIIVASSNRGKPCGERRVVCCPRFASVFLDAKLGRGRFELGPPKIFTADGQDLHPTECRVQCPRLAQQRGEPGAPGDVATRCKICVVGEYEK